MATMQKEQVPKNMIPNGGLMVIYHGTIRKTSPIKQIQPPEKVFGPQKHTNTYLLLRRYLDVWGRVVISNPNLQNHLSHL